MKMLKIMIRRESHSEIFDDCSILRGRVFPSEADSPHDDENDENG